MLEIALIYYTIKHKEHFTTHVNACEYLQIDPSVGYEIKFIEERIKHVLSLWNGDDDPKSAEELRKTFDQYLEMLKPASGWPQQDQSGKGQYAFRGDMLGGSRAPPAPATSEKYAKRCADKIKEGKFKVLDGTVSKEYIKKEPTRLNYDNYQSGPRKPR